MVAVERTSTGMHIMQLPPGSLLRVPSFDRDKGIVEVRFGEQTVGVFIEDLKERASRVDQQTT